MAKNLIADAIADTKELKRLAIEHARVSIAESVTPQIAALLSAKLNEDFSEETPEEDEAKPEAKDESLDALMEKLKAENPEAFEAISKTLAEKKAPKEEEVPAEKEEDEAKPDDESVEVKDETFDIEAALSEIEKGQGVTESDDKDADDAPKEDEVPAEDKPAEDNDDNDDSMDEDYIDRILAEVEAEAEELPAEEEVKDEEPEAIDESLVADAAPIIATLLGVGSVLAAAFAKDLSNAKTPEEKKKVLQNAAAQITNSKGISEKEEEVPAAEDETEETTEQMLELKDQLLEMNLLNAKLVYQNKLLISENFTDDQKARIIVAFDKVKTVNEAKLIFETLNVKTAQRAPVKPVMESLGFRRIGAPLQEVKSTVAKYDDQDPLVAEMMKRAGIKK